jgi:D-alanyl-D-alanine dipeptidase
MDEIVLMADPRVTRIPVDECGEPLVTIDGLAVSDHKDVLGSDRTRVRAGVADRLREAARLLPPGVRLLFVEGWRDPVIQRGYFEDYRDELLRDGIAADADQAHRLASRYVSPPGIAPHVAGAAVDLTLCTADGAELDLGTRVNASPEQSDGGCYTAATNISAEGIANRQILSKAMTEAGFVNYPTEWWHWSYGDRYWALTTGAPTARYGAAGQ